MSDNATSGGQMSRNIGCFNARAMGGGGLYVIAFSLTLVSESADAWNNTTSAGDRGYIIKVRLWTQKSADLRLCKASFVPSKTRRPIRGAASLGIFPGINIS